MSTASRSSGTILIVATLVMAALSLPTGAASEEQSPADRQTAKEALSVFNDLIGGWRGVGQPRRGSNRGAWRQNAEWVWDFEPDSIGIKYDVSDGKLVRNGRVTWDAKAEAFQLELTTPDDLQRTYRGKQDRSKIILSSEPDADGNSYRITITKLNDKRTLVLHEKQSKGQQSYFRIAEVGYTREGVRLANAGDGQPVCIVTGGTGTMKVSHNGKTYYVCCSGCKQAFDDDPAGIIAEAAERKRKAVEKAK